MTNLTTITNKSLLIMSIMLTGMMLLACGRTDEQGCYHNFGATGWLYNDTVMALGDSISSPEAESPDSIVLADIAIGIRHTNDYEFSNLWVELTYATADTVERDTFDVRLADVYGNWYGRGIGVGYQLLDTVVRNRHIDISHPVTLRHIMRADTLPYIQQAGIIVRVKSEE